ncbi:hypothetical protein [Streptomyces sp. NPDC050287]|uniref:hypothetical protein n=1 Tax=Streptomyces sp. NPDC050287 TaxID=3365608 RepID=UPI0037B845AF
MAVPQAVLPPASSTAFPVSSGAPGPQYEQHVSSHAAPTNGTSWEQGPGRPKDIPEAAVVLNQRIIARESLDASVAAALKLKKRIKRFALDNELDHLPMGDIGLGSTGRMARHPRILTHRTAQGRPPAH